MMPIKTLNTTPTPTMNLHRPLAIPSSRTSQPALPSGHMNPVMTPRIITSTKATSPTSSLSVPLAPRAVAVAAAAALEEGIVPLSSIHASSIRRNPSGDGSVSGVYRDAWMLRNCSRSWLTSAAVKPVASNLSKPRGAADVLGTGVPGGSNGDGEGVRWDVDVGGGGAAAAVASVSSSDGVRVSPIEQFT